MVGGIVSGGTVGRVGRRAGATNGVLAGRREGAADVGSVGLDIVSKLVPHGKRVATYGQVGDSRVAVGGSGNGCGRLVVGDPGDADLPLLDGRLVGRVELEKTFG